MPDQYDKSTFDFKVEENHRYRKVNFLGQFSLILEGNLRYQCLKYRESSFVQLSLCFNVEIHTENNN